MSEPRKSIEEHLQCLGKGFRNVLENQIVGAALESEGYGRVLS